ncbi:MAG: ATP-binding protein [Patescibacteria group bacterium]|nr:ATP-binding protein [Patescibacteria group bacterium]
MEQEFDSQKYIKRELFSDVIKHLNKPEMTLITGSRQVGKTVLLLQLKDWLVKEKKISPDDIFYYNLDLIQDWEIFQDQTSFIEFLKERSKKRRIYVLVDEAQKAKEAAKFFKGVYDSRLNAKIVLTGSSSLEIKAKMKESLAGRKIVFSLQPFSFSEFVSAKNKSLYERLISGKKLVLLDQKTFLKLFQEYLVFGGYPRVVLSKSQQEKLLILKEINSSFIEKDILGFLEIKNKLAFNNLIKLLAGQVGQLINIQELATNLGIDRQTVERYIYALEQTFVINSLLPYFENPRQEIIKTPKIYFADLGLRNLALENFSKAEQRLDKGQLLENAIFNELKLCLRNSLGKIRFWRTKQKAEVDFVIIKGKQLLPVEVKYSLKKPKISLGLRNFLEKYQSKRAFLINLSITNQSLKFKRTKINFIYPFELTKIRLK